MIRQTVGNAVRCLYQMIMTVDEETYECHVIDYNKELRNISEAIASFDAFCDDLYVNIHPEDREGFDQFTDPNYFPKELADKVFTSYECRIGASYGWVLLPLKDDMVDLDEYIEMADSKMYEMKVQRDEYRRD